MFEKYRTRTSSTVAYIGGRERAFNKGGYGSTKTRPAPIILNMVDMGNGFELAPLPRKGPSVTPRIKPKGALHWQRTPGGQLFKLGAFAYQWYKKKFDQTHSMPIAPVGVRYKAPGWSRACFSFWQTFNPANNYLRVTHLKGKAEGAHGTCDLREVDFYLIPNYTANGYASWYARYWNGSTWKMAHQWNKRPPVGTSAAAVGFPLYDWGAPIDAPAGHPHLQPHKTPIASPQPPAYTMPYPLQLGKVKRRLDPNYEYGPIPPPPTPPTTTLPPHELRPPGRGEKEKKPRIASAFFNLVRRALVVTEIKDFLDAVARGIGWKPSTGLSSVQYIYRHWDKIDAETMDDILWEIVKNEIEDQIIGRLTKGIKTPYGELVQVGNGLFIIKGKPK